MIKFIIFIIHQLVRRRRCVTPRIWQPIQLNLSLGKGQLYISNIQF